jgi:hypothetical protein
VPAYYTVLQSIASSLLSFHSGTGVSPVQRRLKPAATKQPFDRKSILIAQGENIKYIQSQLGHSSPTATLNIYAPLMKARNPEAAGRLENAVFEATGHKLVTKRKTGPRPRTATP